MDKPKLSEWLQLLSFIFGALGFFAVGVTAFQDIKDHEKRISKIETDAAQTAQERSETNERLARIEESLKYLTRKD